MPSEESDNPFRVTTADAEHAAEARSPNAVELTFAILGTALLAVLVFVVTCYGFGIGLLVLLDGIFPDNEFKIALCVLVGILFGFAASIWVVQMIRRRHHEPGERTNSSGVHRPL